MTDLFNNLAGTLRSLVLEAAKRDVDMVKMSGMKVALVNVHPDSDIGKVKAAFGIVAARASRMFPDLIKHAPVVQIHFDNQWTKPGLDFSTWGYFDSSSDEIVLIPRAVEQDEKRLASIIAHEIAHFMYLKRYSEQARTDWKNFISGTTEIDLRRVLKMLPKSGIYSDGEKAIEKSNPLLYLQLCSVKDMLLQGKKGPLALKRHCPAPFTREAVECLIKQLGNTVRVVERPVSEYGSSDPVEAFAEAVGLLVAYGPRTLQPDVVGMLRQLSPRTRTESADRKVNFIDYPGAALGMMVLNEMAALPSLVSLQQKGNKKEASKKELVNARKRALKCKTPEEARGKAKLAWQLMEKRQIIQVFLDRQDELLGLKYKAPRPDFIDKKAVAWASLSEEQVADAVKWMATHWTTGQLSHLLSRAKDLAKGDRGADARARVELYVRASAMQKQAHKEWRAAANARKHYWR